MELSPTIDIDPEELKLWFEHGEQSYDILKYCESIVVNNPHIFE